MRASRKCAVSRAGDGSPACPRPPRRSSVRGWPPAPRTRTAPRACGPAPRFPRISPGGAVGRAPRAAADHGKARRERPDLAVLPPVIKKITPIDSCASPAFQRRPCASCMPSAVRPIPPRAPSAADAGYRGACLPPARRALFDGRPEGGPSRRRPPSCTGTTSSASGARARPGHPRRPLSSRRALGTFPAPPGTPVARTVQLAIRGEEARPGPRQAQIG